MAVSIRAEFEAKNRLNAWVIDQVAHLVYGPDPTDEQYNAVAVEMGDALHNDIARLASDLAREADRMSRRGF